ncbi:hypothetical protein ANN_21066, partial [Periplaneta americana]
LYVLSLVELLTQPVAEDATSKKRFLTSWVSAIMENCSESTVRSLTAASIRQNASYEEVGCVSSDGSIIIIIDRQKDKSVILDPIVCFEMHEQQPQELCREKQEQTLRVFENKVLRKISGVKRDEVRGGWRKLHNAELHVLFSSPDIIRNIQFRRLRWAGHVARMGKFRNAYRVLVVRPEGNRPLGRPRRRWEGNNEMDLREVGYDDRGWINLAQDRDRWRVYVMAVKAQQCKMAVPAINMDIADVFQELMSDDMGHGMVAPHGQVLRKIFGAKRDEATGEWRKLHNTELHALYSSPNIIRNLKSRRLRWAGHVARMGESRNAYRVLVGRPEGKRPLGRPRRRWEDNIKMDLREVGYDDRDWINLAQDRNRWRAYVRAAMNLKAICKCLRWAGRVARMGESRNAYRVLVGRPEEKILLGKQRLRWEGNIKIDLREVGYDGKDWINLALDRERC